MFDLKLTYFFFIAFFIVLCTQSPYAIKKSNQLFWAFKLCVCTLHTGVYRSYMGYVTEAFQENFLWIV